MSIVTDFPRLERHWKQPEVKHLYKETAGIYKITCILGKSFLDEIYIGQSYDIDERWDSHLNAMSGGYHGNPRIQAICDKYGEQAFRFEVVRSLSKDFKDSCTKEELKEVLNRLEQCYLTAFNPKINICLVAGSTLGTERTDESILNLRAAKAREFSLYHENQGLISGDSLGDFLRENTSLNKSGIYSVINGFSYEYQGYYKCEDYYLSRKVWEKDNPPNQSKVIWDDELGVWEATLVRLRHKRFIGRFELKDQAEEAISEYIEKKEVRTKIIPFSFYHETFGFVVGNDLYRYCKKEKLRGQSLRKLLEGKIYCSQGFYASKAYYLDKSLWEKDNPLPQSKYPHVYWIRVKDTWEAKVNVLGKMNNLGEFENDADAWIAVQQFKANITDEEKEKFRKESLARNAQANSKDFEIFHNKHGLIKGRNASRYPFAEEVNRRKIAQVLRGSLYEHMGYYKTKEYSLDKKAWLRDFPDFKSKYSGVSWVRDQRKWKAEPRINGKAVYLGTFNLENDAIAACEKAKITVNSDSQVA